jgi:3-oxoadipate enol-lactonase
MQAQPLAFEERGSGPHLVFVHGFPLDASMWKGQVAALPKSATCVAVDLRGHGMSSEISPEGVTMDLFADDLAATLDELGAKQIDLCSLSMGGYVAFSFWRRHRDRVRSMIFIDTKAEADGDEAKAGRDATAELVTKEGMAPLWEKLKGVLLADEPTPEALAAAERMVMSCPPATAAADAIAMRDRVDSVADLSQIDVPVTWIHGEQDKLMPMTVAESAVSQLKDATLVAIPNAGHLSPMENPDAVNDAIRNHLARVRG